MNIKPHSNPSAFDTDQGRAGSFLASDAAACLQVAAGRSGRRLIAGRTSASWTTIRRLKEDVRQFAEPGDFLDLPALRCCSGMKVRERLETMVRGADVPVLSSRMPPVGQAWCTRAIWLDQGWIKPDGPAGEVLERHLGRPRPARATGEALTATVVAARV